MENIRKTNLFIVGAAKSGTSSLWSYLKDQPDVYMSDDMVFKEPAYFSPLARRKKMTDDKYKMLFQNAPKTARYLGDASTAYLTDPSSAQLIHEYNPESKIIIILRNPVDRAFSLYNWMTQEGYEYSDNFESALKKEEKRLTKKIPNFLEPEYRYNYAYFTSGLYTQQIKRYIRLFGESVLILKFEDLVSNPNTIFQKISHFLNIPVGKFEKEKVNPSHSIYNAKIQFFLRKLINVKARLTHNNQLKHERDQMLKLGFNNKKISGLDAKLRNELLDKYKTDIRELEALTGMDFQGWLNSSR